MKTVPQSSPDPREVLTAAVGRAARALGLSRQDLGRVLGRDRSALSRGIDPDSKPGELALLLIRCYRDLAVLVGQEPDVMRHWFGTRNSHTGGIPREQVMTVEGLVQVTEYLDAMRGKV